MCREGKDFGERRPIFWKCTAEARFGLKMWSVRPTLRI